MQVLCAKQVFLRRRILPEIFRMGSQNDVVFPTVLLSNYVLEMFSPSANIKENAWADENFLPQKTALGDS
jgi:hypothetical protein